MWHAFGLESPNNDVCTSAGLQGRQNRVHKLEDVWQPSANQGFPLAWGDLLRRELAQGEKLQ